MRICWLKLTAIGVSALALGLNVARAADPVIELPPVPDVPAASLAILQPSNGPAISALIERPRAVQQDPAIAGSPQDADRTGSVQNLGKPGASDEVVQPSADSPQAIQAPAANAPASVDAASGAGAAAPAAPPLQPADLAAAIQAFAASDQPRKAGEASFGKQRLKDRQAIADYYAAHGNSPMWIENNRLSPTGKALLARVDRAGEDGLNLSAFAVPALSNATVDKLAAAELAVSEAVVAYARQASGSRVDPLQIDRLITAKPQVPEVADILAWLSVSADAGHALHDYNPPQPGYAALRDKLAELRQQAPMANDAIPSGPTLRPGMRDARVPLIRTRFGLDLPSAEADADGLVYDTQVAAAVADFQRANGLPASGILTSKTIAALSGGNPSRLENELVANMERWRWLPRDLGTDHIMVNVPDYSLAVTEGDTVVHRARVVVGKPDHQTPIFSDTMRFVIVNPYWNVPLSIIKKEMMPKLAEDPNYFSNHGYEVVEKDGTTFVRQPPGDDNALGRIKFMFPNQHSVYLHDTNARALFGKDKRAFSHGCVRVDQPFKLAEIVLGPAWPEKRVMKLIGGDERTINLPKPLPIHIAYFTSFVDEAGGLQLRDDVYGYSAKVKQALGLRD